MTETKLCSDCGLAKPFSEFRKDKKAKSGLQSQCRVCADANRLRRSRANPEQRRAVQRKSGIKRSYGLTVPQYEGYFLAVNHKCLCGEEAVHLDHCHDSGKIRRALCRNCNLCLGYASDDPQRLRELADYLEAHAA